MGKLTRLLSPNTSTRTQLFGAATMWAIGAAILITRGLSYVHDRHWHAWALALGLALGMAKARLLLTNVARKAVARIQARGTAPFWGFFSLQSWGLVALMMGGGITLRHLIVHPGVVGAGIMGAVYIGVGFALALADRVFWMTALHGVEQVHNPDECRC